MTTDKNTIDPTIAAGDKFVTLALAGFGFPHRRIAALLDVSESVVDDIISPPKPKRKYNKTGKNGKKDAAKTAS